MIKTAIAGATGYTGAELVKLITGHPNAELVAVTTRSYSGKPLTEIFPSLRGIVDITCKEMRQETLKNNFKGKIDCVFLALPHKVAMSWAPLFLEIGIKVIDLSADFRFKNRQAYEGAYQPHSAPDLLGQAAYGLSEIYADEIRQTDLVGNPGCYPTSLLLPLFPLIRAGLVKTDGIISDSKSGVSGAGRSLSLAAHYCEVTESFKPYKVGSHRHVPEMEELLTAAHTGTRGDSDAPTVKITFVPHLLPMSRGMLTTIYAETAEGVSQESIRECLEKTYGNHFFVRILPEGEFPNTAHVRGTNFCDIGFRLDESSKRLIIVSAIDNILKGASGQAIQNMNLMFGLDETTGLKLIPGAI